MIFNIKILKNYKINSKLNKKWMSKQMIIKYYMKKIRINYKIKAKLMIQK